MAARRIGQYVPDWIKIATKVPHEARPNMSAMRAKYETIKTSLDSISAKPEPINWDFYAKNISKPGMVEAFRKAYEAVTVPYPKDVETPKINEKEKELEEHSIKVVKLANEQIAKYEAELQEIRSLKPFEEMTVDEYAAAHPEWNKQLDDEIAKNNWNMEH
ncbi:ATP synthase subunit d, mitochondrial-like [Orbicella faveolata]|uniref:ATP synthase subunit d, mitochondrial-like n=1 Tax=Orbicella faveolata TaxID=48498 RepID=UPI0009E367BC|nr:ATP synthase subunit d, mitochondrial-like [Orbicella faveolata]